MLSCICISKVAIISDQSVMCYSDQMLVNLEFVEPFDGLIYIDESYNKEWCKWEGTSSLYLNLSIPTIDANKDAKSCKTSIKQVFRYFDEHPL